jgi:PAS domain S-box-containing protein
MLGDKAHDALGTPLRQVWHEGWERIAPYAQRVLAGESFFFEDYATTVERHGYPEQAWFTFSYSPLRDDLGAVRGLMCTVFEVTDKVLALARHKEAEERLALSLEASGNIGTWSYCLEDGTTYVDERFARLFQVDAALARKGTELERFTDMIAPADRPRVLEAIATAIRDDSLYDVEYRIPQRGGHTVWVNARGKVFTDAATGRRRFAGIAVDISQRKAAEAAREESERAMLDSEAKFRLIANVIPQMVWSTDAAGVNDYVNERWQEFTGIPTRRLTGDGWQQPVHPDDLPSLLRAWDASVSTGATYEVEHRLLHRSGEYRWVLNRGLPFLDDAGRVRRWMGTLTDIHDQKSGEEELRAAARRKDEFLAMLAHELRNPLAPINNAAQLLALAGADPRRVRQSSEVIIRQVGHMTDLVDDLLDVSRVTRGLVELQRERLDLRAVVASAVEQARPLIEARRQILHTHMDDRGAWVDGDRTRLVQILSNLLNNAAKYTPQGGAIWLAVDIDAGQVRVSVRDNGIGIAAGMLPHVFDLFTQAERTPDRAQGGLGLGLALVRSLAQLHGGRVEARSGGTGQGSSFIVTLPLAASSGTGSAAQARDGGVPAPDVAGAAAAGRRRILVVDDNVDAAQSLADILCSLGHAAATATASHDALAQAGRAWPQVFILDIGLPDIDGYELVRRLRAMAPPDDAARASTRYIALTGYGQAHDRVLSRSAGFDHHFVKPVDLGALLEVIGAAA